MARTVEEEDTRARRWKLLAGLGLGALAIGVPAAVVHRRNRRTPSLRRHGIGRQHVWSWRGSDISFERTGVTRNPVVMLHSLGPGHDGWEWHRAAESLSQHYDLWIPDLPGWGLSTSRRLEYSCELYEDFLTDFLQELINEPAVIVAVGRAAGYAVRVAKEQPHAVRALALVNPWGLARPTTDRPTDRVARTLSDLPILRSSALAMTTSKRAVRKHLEETVFAAPERVDAAVLEHYTCSSRQPGSDRALAALLTGRLDPGVEADTLNPEIPVWLAWGRKCHSPTVETADLWLRWHPPSELEVFDDSGLLPHLEEAGSFSRQLELFLADQTDLDTTPD